MRKSTLLACLWPVIVCLLMLLTYLCAPEFYLHYVLEETSREGMLVEVVTATSALCGAILLFCCIRSVWQPGKNILTQYPAVLLLMVGLASFFMAGEEVSWGQTLFKWKTPENFISGETNLHNSDIPIQELGGVFVIVVFILLPLANRLCPRLIQKFSGLETVLPRIPAIAWIAVALLWKEQKNVYRALVSDYKTRDFYINFMEQINEHKEMLIAIGFLAFGLQVTRMLARRKSVANSRR
jgi:hypothetical protein